MTDKGLGEMLTARRKQLGLTREEAADLAGISQFTLRHWEDGENLLSHVDLLNYLETIGIELKRLELTQVGHPDS